jgi:hypothetical protein
LQRLYRRFDYLLVYKLQRVLERAGHKVERNAFEHLTKYCEQCQKHGQTLYRFKFMLSDDLEFNTSIIIDVFWIPKIAGKPVLHVIDKATTYQAGKFLKDMTLKHV